MADGRKIPYIIEMGINDEKLKRQMSQWDWEEIIGIKGFGKHFEKPAKEASDAIENAFANTSIDWEKALQTDAFQKAVTKIVQHANAELREGLLGKDEAKQVTEFVSEIGKAWKEVGVAMGSDGFARSMAAFAKSVEPLVGQVDKLTAAFGIFSDKINNDTAKVAGGFTVIGDVAGRTAVKVNKSIETMEAKLASIDDMLSEDYGKKFKFDANLEDQFYDIDEAIEKVETNIEQLSKKFNSMSSSDKGFEETRRNLVQLYTEQIELYRKLELVDEEYTKKHSKDDSLLTLNAIDPKAVIGDVRATIETIVGDAKRQLKDISTSTKTTKDGINIPIKLPSQVELVKTINKYVKSINDSDAIHGVRLKLDSGWLNDAANVIEDKTTRAYGDTPADFDKNTTDLVKKTEERFSKIAKVIGDKQQGILDATDDWRKKMINAMSINAKDLEFQFGLESNMENTADALFNKLQEYFERPEYALDIKFNVEKIARDLKASIEAEGIELGVGGGTANIDVNSLMSMLHSLLYGGVPVHTPAKTSDASDSFVPKEVADETDEAIDSGKEYVKVLDETTLHVDKVIESLRVFAREANKANASKGSKAIASRLASKGIDVSQIKKDTSDAVVLKMLQDGLMAKDEMGKPQGGSLVGEIRGIMSANGMDAEKGAGKVAEILARDIMELFDINEIETELEAQVEKRFKQLNLWQGVEKPGRALAALGNVRSTKNKVRLPEMQAIDDAISYFEDAGEDTDALKKLKEARQKFEDGGQTDEAKAEFEKSALAFYDETKDVFKRLKARWGDFKGTVSVEGRKPVLINPKGAYPSRILEIPKDAVITKVEPFEAFEVIDGTGHVGSSARRESSARKAEQQQKQLGRGFSGQDFLVPKPHPKKDVRYEDIEYDTFKTQESERLPQEVALDATIESLEKRAAEIPELVERIEESKKNIAQLEGIKQQIESEISNLQVQDLPEFQMNAFEQYSKRDDSLKEILKNANSALTTNGALNVVDTSKLDKEQQSLVGRLQTLTTNIHNDSKASQELANKIAEIVEAKKLSTEELEIARDKAAQTNYEKQGDLRRAQRELYELQNANEPLDDEAKKARAEAIRAKQKEISEINKFAEQANLYRDLLHNKSLVESRLESYQSQKGALDKNIGENKNYAQKLIKELETSRGPSTDKATKEAETLATQLIEVKERLYAEAKTYANILNDSSVDDKTRETALGQLQETLRGLTQITSKFATIQPYVPKTYLYNSSQQNNVDKWNKKYTNSEVRKLEKELNGLEKQLKTEEDEVKVAELKKKIANTKRNLTRLKKNVPDNVSSKKQTELGNIERQLSEEQSKLFGDENRKKAADKASSDLESTKQDATFLAKYNELLEKETSLLEEVNKLKREGSDKSVIDGKTEELKQATKALDDFLKKEKTMERTAYARKQAVEYQAQLHTAYRKRSVFDNQIGDINEDEENLSKYHLSGRVGSRALRRTEREVASEFINSGYMQHFSDMFGAKKQLEEAQSAYETAMNNFYEATDKQWDESLPEEQRVEWEKASTKALEDAERAKLQSDQIRNTILKTSKDEDFFRKLNTLVDNQNDRLALHMPTEDINNPKKVREFLTSDKGRWIAEQYQSEEKVLWDEYYEHLRQQQQNAISEFKQSWSVENGVLKATFKKSNVLGGWDDDLKSYDVEKNEQKRIEKLKKDIEAEREPIDGIIKDLQTQKKAAMRYGVVSDDDLKNDKLLQQNEQYNKNILKLTDDRIKLERELESIKADDSLDEKKQEKEIKRKQKEIDAINQEIQRNQALIDNRVKLMELHKQEKEESKQTPEEKALLATEKLIGMKQSLAQAEEKVAARKADYESAKGTENEIKMLEALDKQIKKRDQIQEQIAVTEKKIERLGKVTQKTEDAQDEVASAVEGTASGKASSGLLGLIKEAVGEVGNVDLTKVEEILSKILAILSGNGVVGTNRSSEMDAKLARIKELEAKQQLANEQKKTAETVKQVENAKKETTATTKQRGKTLSPERDAFYESELKYQPKELIPDKAQEEAIALKKTLDEMYTKGEAETVEFMNQQVKLANLLSALRSKLGKGKAPADEWKTYVSELLGNTDNVLIGNVGKRDYKSKLKALGAEDDVQSAQQVVKAKQEEAKAEVKITEEKKKQEKIRFTRKEKKELNRLKSEVKDYNPDDTTGTGSEFGGFATEKTLAAILEVLNKISTSGVPKNGGKSGGADDKDSSKDDELDRLAKKSGVSDVRGAIKQHGTLEARGVLKDISSEKIQKYNAAYNELIDKHKEFDAAGTLYDPNNQKTLGNMAIKVKDLGKQLEKSVAEAEQLEQLVNSSGTYQGRSLGSKEIVGNIDDVTFEELAKKRLQELGAEHVKFDKIHKRAIGTKRLDNKTVADLEVKYNDLSKAMYTYQKAERESLTGVPAFINGFKKKFNSIMQYLSMTMSIHQVLAQLRKGVQYVREIDLALTELKKVTDETEETYDKFLETAAKTGARLGTTISAVTEATATFAKLGYSMEQATEMAESAIVYKNVGDNIASTEDAADSIISTMKGFRLEASESMRIVDRFNEVGNRFAITSQGIGEALRLSASALSEGGNSLDESIGLITAAM